MEDVLTLCVLAISAVLVYHWSYSILWFKVGSLFDVVVAPSSNDNLEIPKLELNDNTFFYKLYSEYSVPSHKVMQAMRILFSTAMVTYLVTIEIILWQIKTADGQQTADFVTKWVWPFVSALLSVLLILVQPFFIVMSLLNKFFDEKLDIDRLVILSCGFITALIASLNFTNIGPFSHAESMLTKLSIVGITVMAILAGVASTSTLYCTFLIMKRRFFPSNTTPTADTMSNIGTGYLLWTADDSATRQIDTYQRNIEEYVQTLNKLDQEPGGKSSALRYQLMEKIGCFQLEIAKLEKTIQQPPHIRTLKKAFNLTFLLYCLHKMISTFTRTIPYMIASMFKNVNNNLSEWTADPLAITIARVMDILLFRFNYQYELDSLTKQVSLILSTSLFVCSFSTVATTISYLIALLPNRFRVLAMYAMQSIEKSEELPIHRKVSKYSTSRKNPSLIKNLIVSELTGVYVVATILSIRSNLPFDVSEKVNELLSERFTVPNAVIDSWFEIIYAASCVLTFVCVKLAERMLSSNSAWMAIEMNR